MIMMFGSFSASARTGRASARTACAGRRLGKSLSTEKKQARDEYDKTPCHCAEKRLMLFLQSGREMGPRLHFTHCHVKGEGLTPLSLPSELLDEIHRCYREIVVAQMETAELREFYVEHKTKRYERLDVAELEAEVENLGGRLP
jgi:hypothetical protein